MQRTVEKVFFALIRFCFGTQIDEETKNLITPEILPQLLALSKRHDLAHLVADALDKNGLLPQASQAKKSFAYEKNMAVYRHEQMQYEFEQVCTALENAKIPFIPLKGAVLKNYYPQAWMRTSCDIDILVKPEDHEKTLLFLKDTFGYEIPDEKNSHEQSLRGEASHIELHYCLGDNGEIEKAFSSLWEDAELMPEKCYWYTMSAPHFYLYHIYHMVHHFEDGGGCGVRTFIDLWLMNKNSCFTQGLDQTKKWLTEYNLLTFSQVATAFSKVVMEDEEKTDLLSRFCEYILSGGVYGTLANRVLTQQSKKGGRVSYFLRRLIIPYKEMVFKYPSLKKFPILLPFYQVMRWVKLIFSKKSRQRAKNEFSTSKQVDKDKQQAQQQFLRELGLSVKEKIK